MSAERYKYCIVPMCTNTTSSTPNKVFVDVPRNKIDRKRWCLAINRDGKKNLPLSEQSIRHVCEDHFNMEKDVENYMRVKLQGVRVCLKKGVLPHIFECQKPSKVAPSTERAAKRQRVLLIQELLNAPTTSSIADMSSLPTAVVDEIPTLPFLDVESRPAPSTEDKITQTNMHVSYRSKSTNTIKNASVEVGCGTSVQMQDSACGPSPRKGSAESFELSEAESESLPDEDSDYEDDGDQESDYEPEEDEDEAKKQIRMCIMNAVRKETLMCLGIPKKISYMVDFLATQSKSPAIDVVITLKKIRQNETYANLAMLFGMSKSNIARIFHKTLFALASVLQNLIVWPDAQTIASSLPIPFRARYAKTQCIVDCFEVEIEKPSDSQHQGLTWSEYKKANTLKYLVSCTPDGIVSFISKGYGGRTSDTTVVEESGFLDHLLPNLEVMADRGFKNISHLVEARNCKIVRPPSVSADQPMTYAEVKSSRRISALRIHVERLIRRFREFYMCDRHACIDHNLVPLYDHVIIIAGGLINLQSSIIKT